jgi:aldehyde dehydrogenase (NAD+)
MFVKASRSGKHVYLRLVEAYRDARGRTHHRQIAQLGRVDELRPADVDALVRGLARYSGYALVPRAPAPAPSAPAATPPVPPRRNRRTSRNDAVAQAAELAGRFYVDGAWVAPAAAVRHGAVVDPSTETTIARVALGTATDIDRAVAAAAAAAMDFARTTPAERSALLARVATALERRAPELAVLLGAEMGAPRWLADAAHVPAGVGHCGQAQRTLAGYAFEAPAGTARMRREPVGVCALITPWNWPVSQIACKVAYALAAGCTMVLKPSERAPLNALVVAQALDEAGVPRGVFNLVNGSGAEAGAALCAHAGVDMVSFTGSNRGGVAASRRAAATIKRVALELGGNSACVVLDDADLEASVAACLLQLTINSGQNCNAPSRLVVPRAWHDAACEIAAAVAAQIPLAPPEAGEPGAMGPQANAVQFARVDAIVRMGVADGARLVAGGPGRAAGHARGYYAAPTVFGAVDRKMRLAREEIFGPVLAIVPHDGDDDAVAIANDSVYGLCAYVHAGSADRARAVAARLRVGSVHVNGAVGDLAAPFGGYKQSGNGREWGVFGLEAFLETKAVFGA